MRYYLVDKVTAIERGKSIKGIKCVTLTDQTVHDHFPTMPIFPGSLIVEGLAQLGGCLIEVSMNQDPQAQPLRAVLVQIDKMKFYKPTFAGDRLEYTVEVQSLHPDCARLAVSASMDGEVRVSGALTLAMIEPQVEAITQQRKEVYSVWFREVKECPLIL